MRIEREGRKVKQRRMAIVLKLEIQYGVYENRDVQKMVEEFLVGLRSYKYASAGGMLKVRKLTVLCTEFLRPTSTE